MMGSDEERNHLSQIKTVPGEDFESAEYFFCDFLAGNIMAIVGDDHPSSFEFPLGCCGLSYVMIKCGQEQGELFFLTESKIVSQPLCLVDCEFCVMPDRVTGKSCP